MDSPRRSQRVQALGKRTDIFSPSLSVVRRAKLKKLATHHSPNDNGVGSENAALISPARKKRDRPSKSTDEIAGMETGTVENHGRKRSLRSRNKAVDKRKEPPPLHCSGSAVFVSDSLNVVENVEHPTAVGQNGPLPSLNSPDATGFRRSTRTVHPSRKALESFAGFPVLNFVKRARPVLPEKTFSSLPAFSTETLSSQCVSIPAEVEAAPRSARKPRPDKAKKTAVSKGRKKGIASDGSANPPLATSLEEKDMQKSKEPRKGSKYAPDVETDSSVAALRRSQRLTCRKASALNHTASESFQHLPCPPTPALKKTKRSTVDRTRKTSKAKSNAVLAEDLERESFGLTGAVEDTVSDGPDVALVDPSTVTALEIMTQPEQAIEVEQAGSQLSNDRLKKSRTKLVPDTGRKGSHLVLLRDTIDLDLSAVHRHPRSRSTPFQLAKKARSRSNLSTKSSDSSRYDDLEALFMAESSTSSASKRSKRKDVDLDGVAEWFSMDETPLNDTVLISPIRASYRPKSHFLLETIEELAEITVIEPIAAETGGAEWQSTVEVLSLSNVQSPPDLSRQVSERSTVDEFASPDAERFHSPVLSEVSADSWHSATDVLGNDVPMYGTAELQISTVGGQNVMIEVPIGRSSPRISPGRSPRSAVSDERSGRASPEPTAPAVSAQGLLLSVSTVSENSVAPEHTQSFPSTLDSHNETSMFTQQFEFLSSLPSLSQMGDPLAHSTPLPSGAGSSRNKDTNAENGPISVHNMPSTSSSSDPVDNLVPDDLPSNEQATVEDIPERPVTPVQTDRREMEMGVQTVSSPKRPYCLERDLVSPIQEILQHNATTDQFRVKMCNGDVAVVSRIKLKENILYQQMLIDWYSKSINAYAFSDAPVNPE